jgi:hypothetical protein
MVVVNQNDLNINNGTNRTDTISNESFVHFRIDSIDTLDFIIFYKYVFVEFPNAC